MHPHLNTEEKHAQASAEPITDDIVYGAAGGDCHATCHIGVYGKANHPRDERPQQRILALRPRLAVLNEAAEVDKAPTPARIPRMIPVTRFCVICARL